MQQHGQWRARNGRVIRITVEETPSTLCLIVEGRLGGESVAALEGVVGRLRTDRADRKLVIDLAGVSGMDASGRLLVNTFRSRGVCLRNLDPLAESLLTMELEEVGICRA